MKMPDTLVIQSLRQIVEHKQHAKVTHPHGAKPQRVDLFTASAILALYDGLASSPANQAKLVSYPIPVMAHIAFKLLANARQSL